jgi:hypothetical protein
VCALQSPTDSEYPKPVLSLRSAGHTTDIGNLSFLYLLQSVQLVLKFRIVANNPVVGVETDIQTMKQDQTSESDFGIESVVQPARTDSYNFGSFLVASEAGSINKIYELVIHLAWVYTDRRHIWSELAYHCISMCVEIGS